VVYGETGVGKEWTQEIIFKGEKTLAVGIQFQNLSPKLSGMLFVFANSSKDK
jgi:hypothetical protein